MSATSSAARALLRGTHGARCCVCRAPTWAARGPVLGATAAATSSVSRFFSTSQPSASPSPAYVSAPVPSRSIIEISGRDTLKLLQGLVTNNVAHLGSPPQQGGEQGALAPVHHSALYAGFLHPNGRLLADTLLYALPSAAASTPSDSVLIEVDSRAADSLLSFLKKFKLRSKVTLRAAASDEWKVWQLWTPGGTALTAPTESSPAPSSEILQALAAVAARQAQVRRDPRSAHLGFRALIPGSSAIESQLSNAGDTATYLAHRILQGIPEGHDDIIDASSLPLEANMDLNAGVDFTKGCYVGQELTARTHHTGVVRKRVVPVSFYPADQLPPSSLALDSSFQTLSNAANLDVRSSSSASSATRRARSAGKLLGSTVHNLGLGLLRLDQVERAQLEAGEEGGARMRTAVKGADGQEREIGIRPFIPASWDPQVVESVRLSTA
ncbi:ccr4 associated factor [Tilletia horrida]|uniref:Ccr4 associated factor n=1 Tax=Tilletia horrida TaxID=155126 RepID=A0AAN6GI67_9BASI|nr:ccr4 associated factor [Tilletia horrida]